MEAEWIAEIEAEIERDLEQHLPGLEPANRQNLVDRLLQKVQTAVEQEIDRERQRCVQICRERVDLWRRTRANKSGVERAREEARARANEAQYLADWLATQEEPPEVSEVLPTVN